MEEKIIQIATDLFQEQVTTTTKMGDIEKWDSLGHINLFMGIESELGIHCELDEIIQSDSIKKIIVLVKKHDAK